MGFAVGLADGFALGLAVVGSRVGTELGNKLGWWVDKAVGSIVVIDEGGAVIITLGEAEGSGVGGAVGIIVGKNVCKVTSVAAMSALRPSQAVLPAQPCRTR